MGGSKVAPKRRAGRLNHPGGPETEGGWGGSTPREEEGPSRGLRGPSWGGIIGALSGPSSPW